MKIRPRRNRKTTTIRNLVRQTSITPHDLVLPLFIIDGDDTREPIASMPGCFRLGKAALLQEVKQVHALDIPAIALFPRIQDRLKDRQASESRNDNGLLQTRIKQIKDACPEITVITDVAMDAYSSDGHDGLVVDGKIKNDPTLDILAGMALAQARAGADIIAPSDMMDGRVGFIRDALDREGYTEVSILAYSVKYASSFYGPFRDALDSAPRGGDKKTYQMDPANAIEAIREVELDIVEGADIVMVKPALAYLDVISRLKQCINIPLAAFNVSGEYAMLKAAAQNGWLDEQSVMMEMTLAIKRAGADMILTYFAKDIAHLLQS
ncbi:MAG: porphobilinogen synthase [Chitinivibrionales bacterium]|nr:porphobilinogen synthase [Chitinivibrionales bacterium]